MAQRDYSREEVLEIVEREAQERGIPREDFLRFAYIETGGRFDENAENRRTHAKGLFQFLPSTARDYGIAGREFDPVANTDAAAEMYQRNMRDLARRHERSGYPYLSGETAPNGLDLYLAHQQGAAGYGSIQTAIATGEFGKVRDGRGREIDMRSHVLGNIGNDAQSLTGFSKDQLAQMSDGDLARNFAQYYERKFDAIRIPEMGIQAETARAEQPAARQTPAAPADAPQQEGIALTRAYEMGVEHERIRYAINRESSPNYHPGIDGKHLEDGYIDCSGWVSRLQNATMDEINREAGREVFTSRDKFSPLGENAAAIVARSARQSGVHLQGGDVNVANLKEGMVIGVDSGARGIDHIVMVVKDPQTGQLLASESTSRRDGPHNENGVHVQPLDDYLAYAGERGFRLSASDPLYKARDLLQDRQLAVGARSAEDGIPAYGERNAEVKALQENLKALGIHADDGTLLAGTGYYGDKTREVLANYQRQNGLEPTGTADRATLDALDRSLADSRNVEAAAPMPQPSGRAPLVSDASHPNHGLFAEVSRRLAEQTGNAPRPETVANIAMQMLENGFRSGRDIQGFTVRGSDVHIQGSVAGSRVSVDLNAPTADLQAMSDHMSKQALEQQTLERQRAQAPSMAQ